MTTLPIDPKDAKRVIRCAKKLGRDLRLTSRSSSGGLVERGGVKYQQAVIVACALHPEYVGAIIEYSAEQFQLIAGRRAIYLMDDSGQ